MKIPLVIVLVAVALVTVGTLAAMNKACKRSQHNMGGALRCPPYGTT